MTEGITACKRFCSLLPATARIVIFCRFGTGCRRSKVFFICDFLIERMRKFATRIGNSVFCIATIMVANCRFRSVLCTCCVVVGNVVSKLVSECITACKRFCSLFAATARIVIFCRFGTGGFQSKILLFDFLLGKRMRMLFLTANKTDCCT